MSKKTTKILSVLIAAILVAGLAACGGSGGTQTPPPGASAQSTSESSAPAQVSPEKVEINFWPFKWEPYADEWWEKWITEFNNQSETTKVTYEIIAFGDAYDQKLRAAQASGTAPDVVLSAMTNVIGMYASQGLLLPMDDYMPAGAFDGVFKDARDSILFQGSHYAYPMFVETLGVLYYRKDLFINAGLDPNKPPETWDELIDMAKVLTNEPNGIYGYSMAGTGEESGVVSWQFDNMLGSPAITDDWAKANVNNPEHVQIFEFWKRLRDEKVVPPQALSEWWNLKALCEGKVAMQVSGSWCIGQIRGEYSEIVDEANIGVTNIPTPDGNCKVPTTTIGGYFLGIDALSKNPQNAAEFITWLLHDNTEPMMDFFERATFCRFPVTQRLDEALKGNTATQNDPFIQPIMERVVPYAVPEPSYPFDIRQAVANALDRVILENMDIKQSLEQCEKEINEFIELENLPAKLPG